MRKSSLVFGLVLIASAAGVWGLLRVGLEAGANPTAADPKLKVTPSEKVESGMADADALGWLELASGAASGSKILTLHGNASTVLDLKNDDASRAMSGASGTYALGTGIRLSNVRFFDPRNSYAEYVNLTKSIGSGSFNVTGLNLAAGRTVVVVFEFNVVPAGTSTLELTAAFS